MWHILSRECVTSFFFYNKKKDMSNIKRYCVTSEEHIGPNCFRVHRGYTLGNPYTHIKDRKTIGQVIVTTREEAISRYEKYFEESLKYRPEFAEEFEKMVDAAMNYDEVLIGCYCNLDEKCHADFIIKRIKQECRKRMLQKLMEQRKNTK